MKGEEKEEKRVLEDIGKRLIQLRLKAGFGSYETFAIHYELSRMQYWRLENGKTNLTIKSLKRILDIHNVTIEKFFAMNPNPGKK